MNFAIRLTPLPLLLAAALLFPACQAPPKYKKPSGKFAEWKSYEGKNFYPSSGTVTAIDTIANTITISHGRHQSVYPVTAKTRLIHEGTDIPLAQMPKGQEVKYTLSEDGTQLLTVWFGQHLFQFHPPSKTNKGAMNTL